MDMKAATQAAKKAVTTLIGDGKVGVLAFFEKMCDAHDAHNERVRSGVAGQVKLLRRAGVCAFTDSFRAYTGVTTYIHRVIIDGGGHQKGAATGFKGDGTNHPSGAMYGRRVHETLSRWASGRPPMDVPVTTAYPNTRCKFADRFVKHACWDPAGYRWAPVDADTVVSSGRHSSLRVATLVDMVVFDTRTGRIGIVELKTGMNGSWDKRQPGKIRHFGDKMESNTPKNRAIVQAALTAAMYIVTFGINPDLVCPYVVRMYNKEDGPSSRDVGMERIEVSKRRLAVALRLISGATQ